MDFFVALLLFLGPLIVFGVLIGRTLESRHFRRLEQHAQANAGFFVTQLKSFPYAISADAAKSGAPIGAVTPTLVCTEVVIASDYLKNFFASWRNFFGGEVRSYSRMTDRAKREAVARLIDQAKALGFNAICNVRVETAEIGDRRKKGAQAMASCLAYATAYHCVEASGRGAMGGLTPDVAWNG
jgi:uncharacterized protein YbjQ (UPF0145 family)